MDIWENRTHRAECRRTECLWITERTEGSAANNHICFTDFNWWALLVNLLFRAKQMKTRGTENSFCTVRRDRLNTESIPSEGRKVTTVVANIQSIFDNNEVVQLLETSFKVPTSLSSADSVLKRPIASLMMSVSSRSGWSATMIFLFSSSHSWKPVVGLNR